MKPFHFISLDNPFQPNYGGTWDIHYRLKYFNNQNLIHKVYFFHKESVSFTNDNSIPLARNMNWLQWLSAIPFTVISRNSNVLLRELLYDNNPIWFEGIHTTFFLPKIKKLQPQRKTFIRIHNHEAQYYHELGLFSPSILKKIYFYTETTKLKIWEKKVWALADKLFSISSEEAQYMQAYNKHSYFLPSFIPDMPIRPFKMSCEPFRLIFHGNFEIITNQKSALWLFHFVRKYPFFRLAFYGNQAKMFSKYPIEILDNQKPLEIQLSRNDIFVLPIFQKSGVKIKFLDSLRTGLPVLATPDAIRGSGLNNFICFHNFDELCVLLQNLKTYLPALNLQYSNFLEVYNNQKNFEFLLKQLNE